MRGVAVFRFSLLAAATIALLPLTAAAQEDAAAQEAAAVLKKAAICEDIRDYQPHNPGVVFSIGIGKLHCYCEYDPVPAETVVYHRWYHHDRLTTVRRLYLKPPRWATYSSIQLRQSDKGPWRVEIAGQDGITAVLRFSITE